MNTEQLKTADKTLLDQIKNQVASENFNKHRWDLLYPYEERELWPVVCERYATAKAQASCEATLKNAAENAKVTDPFQQAKSAGLKDIQTIQSYISNNPAKIDKYSILDKSNITIV